MSNHYCAFALRTAGLGLALALGLTSAATLTTAAPSRAVLCRASVEVRGFLAMSTE